MNVLCIDRNFFDLIDHNINKGSVPFSAFFKKSYKLKYIHEHNLCGQGQFNDMEPMKFNFELEYNDECWYPMNDDGLLPDNNDFGRPLNTSYGNNYRDYPSNTRIGWRGPMIRISDIIDDEFYYDNRSE